MTEPTGEGPRPTGAFTSSLTTMVGGVAQLYQGDLDLGRQAAAILAEEDLGEHVVVEELHYGALAVTQQLEELEPDALILIGATKGDREPGTVTRRRVGDLGLDVDTVQGAVHDAAVGYVDLDLVVTVAWGLGALPERTITVEVEPARTTPGAELSETAEESLQEALAVVREEVELTPLMDMASWVADSLEGRDMDDSEALRALEALLEALQIRDREGRWGRTFAERDRLELAMGGGDTSEEMNHADWGTWWALIEELDRLERWTGEQAW